MSDKTARLDGVGGRGGGRRLGWRGAAAGGGGLSAPPTPFPPPPALQPPQGRRGGGGAAGRHWRGPGRRATRNRIRCGCICVCGCAGRIHTRTGRPHVCVDGPAFAEAPPPCNHCGRLTTGAGGSRGGCWRRVGEEVGHEAACSSGRRMPRCRSSPCRGGCGWRLWRVGEEARGGSRDLARIRCLVDGRLGRRSARRRRACGSRPCGGRRRISQAGRRTCD